MRYQGITCAVDACERAARNRGWCFMHYARWFRTGDPLGGRVVRTTEDRFWAKINKDGPIPSCRPDLGPCWIWTGAHNNTGYGSFAGDGLVPVLAHVYAYALLVAPTPEGQERDHLCRNRGCANPFHLELVTHRENVLRGMAGAVNREKTHCTHGHPFDEANTYIAPGALRRACRLCRSIRRAARRARVREALA